MATRRMSFNIYSKQIQPQIGDNPVFEHKEKDGYGRLQYQRYYIRREIMN
jgi:hypothetical protein